MSGICGIVRFDGAPVDGALLERMIEGIAWRGPEGRGRFIEGPAGLGFVRFATTPEAVREEQPLGDPESGLVLVMDGRVDNREEMLAALRQRGASLPDDTDAHILLASWKEWGEDCLQHIVGDFALAIWDARRRRLVAARDCMGLRPFYWAADAAHLVFASTPLAVLEDAAFPGDLNEGMVGEILAVVNAHPRETLWGGVFRLPPGYILETGAGGPRWRRWWDPVVDYRRRGRGDEEMVEGFRAALDAAVGARLRSREGVGVFLSGGIDSGSVARVAARLAARIPGSQRLRTWTVTFPGREFDESAEARETAGTVMDSMLVPWEPSSAAWPSEAPDAAGFPLGDALYGNFPALCRRILDRGDRILLTGHGGDEWVGRTSGDLAVSLLEGRPAELVRRMHWLSGGRPRKFLSLLLRAVAGPLLPLAVGRRMLRRSLRPALLPWLSADFRSRIDLVSRVFAAEREAVDGRGPAGHLPGMTSFAWWQDGFECEERNFLSRGLETRHPLLDRRVVEFLLQTPPALRWNGGETKILLRRAVEPDVPEGLRRREFKPHATAMVVEQSRRLRSEGSGAFPLLEGRGILVPGFFAGAAAESLSLNGIHAHCNSESLEAWLRGR